MHRRGNVGHRRDQNRRNSVSPSTERDKNALSGADAGQLPLPFAGEIPLSAERLEARKAATLAAFDALSALIDGPTARTA